MTRELTGRQMAALRRTLAVMTTLQQHKETMPIQMAASFLLVALNEGKSLRELCDITGASQSTMSRQLLDLGERNRHLEPGLGLVKSKVDPMELRRKQYRLTPKGWNLVNTLLALMEKDDVRTKDIEPSRTDDGRDVGAAA